MQANIRDMATRLSSRKNRRARRHLPRNRRTRVGFVRGVGPWAALLLVFAVAVIWGRRACQSAKPKAGYPQRKIDPRPRTFDPRKIPRHLLVLRTQQTYRMAVCAADYRGRCVQRIPLERYVAGVVAAEEGVFVKQGPPDRVAEAWKLQAIAARSYAIFAALADKYYVARTGFHLTDTPRDQAYTDQVPKAVRRVVRQTRGQVLVDRRGRLVYAEYSASCRSRGTADVVHPRQRIACHPRCAEHAYRGSTHRRGMCQWGSLLFALEGRRLGWLRQRYYPNARIRAL